MSAKQIQQQKTAVDKSVSADPLGWPITQCESDAHVFWPSYCSLSESSKTSLYKHVKLYDSVFNFVLFHVAHDD